jgi:hypothetical protein
VTEPVIVTLLGKNYWDSTLRTPWGEAEWCRPLPQPVPGKPGHVQVGHLMVFPAEDAGELLASGEMRHDPEGYYYSVTTDGDRVFLHVWAENGNWVWVLHEMRVDRGDRCFFLGHDPDRWLLGVFPD